MNSPRFKFGGLAGSRMKQLIAVRFADGKKELYSLDGPVAPETAREITQSQVPLARTILVSVADCGHGAPVCQAPVPTSATSLRNYGG